MSVILHESIGAKNTPKEVFVEAIEDELRILIPSVGDVTPGSCAAYWATNKPATSIVKYRLSGVLSWTDVIDDPNYMLFHAVPITGLKLGDVYDIFIQSTIAETGEEAHEILSVVISDTAIINNSKNIKAIFADKDVSGNIVTKTISVSDISAEASTYTEPYSDTENVSTLYGMIVNGDVVSLSSKVGGTMSTSVEEIEE